VFYTEEEEVIDTDGQILTKTIYGNGLVEYHNDMLILNRIGGPAVIHPNSYQAYYISGKLHRTNGPAVTRSDGTQEYWINGNKFTSEGYPKAVLEYKLKQLVG
jgi:hypothetical protein